jgi:hypothetical protein
MTDRELLQQALDALYENTSYSMHGDPRTYQDQRNHDTIKELQAKLAQPEPAECDGGQCGIGGYCKQCPKTQHEPEPVAWVSDREARMVWWNDKFTHISQAPPRNTPLYTAPPKKEWIGLTDEEIRNSATQGRTDFSRPPYEEFYRAIEAKLKEKNT